MRAAVTLDVSGDDLGIPYLTKPMLDLWVHALHGPDPFLVVGRIDDDLQFIQTYRNAPDDFTVEYRAGADADIVSTTVDTPGAVVEAIWDWIQEKAR
ncbi:hypothetical protein [Dactylosporangium sp. NPDC051541]|uniref:hypothetical protein n=1 Tax=Dactylosporangium sp. NPDC051541 TaxID=3363977 RepID=UPI00379945D7